MAWFAIYDINTKELRSVGETVGDDDGLTAKGFAKKALGAPPDFAVSQWDKATLAMIPIPQVLNAISPPVTKVQASGILKALLENPPTAGSPWTQLQRDQAVYALLLRAFLDLKNGTVY